MKRHQLLEPIEGVRDKQLRKLTELLDSKFRIPGTNIRFGLDFIIGLVPYLGDVTSFALSGYLITLMMSKGTSTKLILKMLGNLMIDAIVGAIPILGDLFDLGFKANRRNLELFREYQEEGKHRGSSKKMLITVGIVMAVCFLLLIYGIFKLFELLFSLI